MANIAKSSIKHIGRQVAAESGGHSIILDEPVSSKGTDAGANPVQYLLMALLPFDHRRIFSCQSWC